MRERPFVIDESHEIPFSCTLIESPASQKDRLVWDELLANSAFTRTVATIRYRRNIHVGRHKRLQEAMRSRTLGRRQVKGGARQVIEYRRRLKPGDVVSVLNQFGLTPLWHGAIAFFIFDGETWFPPDTRTAQAISAQDRYGRRRLFVEVFADTNRSGLIRAWKSFSYLQKSLPGYHAKWRRSLSTLQKRVLRLHQRGLNPKEIYVAMLRSLPEWDESLEATRRAVYRIVRRARVRCA